MTDKSFRIHSVERLASWVHDPTREPLEEVLSDLNDHELWILIDSSSEHIARIAWSEFGRRKSLADLKINTVSTKEGVRVDVSGTARPLHVVPVFFPTGKNTRR